MIHLGFVYRHIKRRDRFIPIGITYDAFRQCDMVRYKRVGSNTETTFTRSVEDWEKSFRLLKD